MFQQLPRMNTDLALLLVYSTILTATLCAPSGPTLNDLLAFNCPSDQPFKCLPYGACCRGSEFCHSGLCESCFPLNIQESELLHWCQDKGQFDVSLMRNSGCRLACQDVFNSTQLAHNESSAVSYLEISSPPSARKHEVIEDNEIHIKLWITLLVSVCLVLSLSLNVCLIRRMWISLKRNRTPVVPVSKKNIEDKENSFNANPNGSKDPNLDEASKALLNNKGSHDKKDDTYVPLEEPINIEIDDKDVANKKESRQDISTKQILNSEQFRKVPSMFAVDETHRADWKIAQTDVDIHHEEHKPHANASCGDGINNILLNVKDQNNLHVELPQSQITSQPRVGVTGTHKQKLLPQTYGSSERVCPTVINSIPLHAVSNSELRSQVCMGEDAHETSF